MLLVDPHPQLAWRAFTTHLDRPLTAFPSPPDLIGGLALHAPAPFAGPDASLRAAVRELLRHGGFKPTGRSKPAAEYLAKAAEAGNLASINALVDACNVASLHSGFPISVVDLDRAAPPYRIGLAPAEATYIFNSGGQTIDIGGLLCLWDESGPCANAVKDAQRTKTHPDTRRTLSVVWGCRGYEDRLDATITWYRSLLEDLGATTVAVG